MATIGLLGLIVAIAGGVAFYQLLSLGDNNHDDESDKMG
jgi:hypothetical protein